MKEEKNKQYGGFDKVFFSARLDLTRLFVVDQRTE